MRIEQRINHGGQVVCADLPVNPSAREIATVRHELARITRESASCCPECFTPPGMVHFLGCSLAAAPQLDRLRKEAGII